MKKNILAYCGTTLAALAMVMISCDDDKDLGVTLDEVLTISSITLDKTEYDAGDNVICLLKNQELQLSAQVLPENVYNPTVRWTSSDESVATVSQDGKIVTKDKEGEAIIHITPEIGFGPSAATPSRRVRVMNEFVPMESITVNNIPTEAIAAGDEYQLNVSSMPANVTFKRYKYESSEPEIATISADGVVKGVSKGKTTIKVIADDMGSGTPVSTSFEMEIKIVVPIEGMEFEQDVELSTLGYGQEYQVKYNLEPADATSSLLTWTSDNEGVVSVDKTGKLKVHAMGAGTATITASYGPVTRSVKVDVAEGRLCYSFANGISPWRVENNATFTSDGEKSIVQMGASGKYRGDLALVKKGDNKILTITPNTYQYVAVKFRPLSVLKPGNNSAGCIKFEIYDDPMTIGYNYVGMGNANNSYSLLNRTEISTTEPNIIYYDLMSKFDNQNPADRTKFDLVQFKFVIADYQAPATSYDIYWVRSFKTLEELQEFVNNENNR